MKKNPRPCNCGKRDLRAIVRASAKNADPAFVRELLKRRQQGKG